MADGYPVIPEEVPVLFRAAMQRLAGSGAIAIARVREVSVSEEVAPLIHQDGIYL